ncbi:T9SS type A sorting domain-containing protein [Flavobacterium sp.]|uniref:T9SS type A sorting domain-containing protein n=1 Tax=Flavobacterium sp. TaxID=239 RepID=UPI003D6A4EE0
MKKIYFLVLALGLFTEAGAQVITIPDAAFKTRLLEASPSQGIAKDIHGNNITIDMNHNGEIEVSETLNVTSLFVFHMPAMHDLTGVGSFANLRNLYCYNLALSSANVTSLTNLVELELTFCDLESVNVTGLTHLKKLLVDKNQLHDLNLTGLSGLERLSCDNNQLTNLNVSQLSNLKYLHCNNNQLLSLDITGLSHLNEVLCTNNQLLTLNLTGLTGLQSLSCGNNQLTSLNATGSHNLEYLYCTNNHITNLNVSGLTNLEYLYCHLNQLASLNVSGLTNLTDMYCSSNQLTNLDVNGLSNLTTLACDNNNLGAILFKDTGYTGGVNDIFTFSNNPNLVLVCTNDSKISLVQNIVNQYNYVNCAVGSSCTVLNSDDFASAPVFSVYPNPTHDVLNIDGDDAIKFTSIHIYNTLGQLVYNIPNAQNSKTVDVSNLASGNYFIKVSSDRGISNIKFIKN